MNGRLRLAVFLDTLKDAISSWVVKQLPQHIILLATIHLWAVVSTAENGMEITVSEAIAKWQENRIQ